MHSLLSKNMYPKTPFAFVLYVLSPFKKWVAFIGLVCLLIASDLAFRPYLSKIILDKLQNSNSDNVLNLLLVPISIFLSLSILVNLAWRLMDYTWLNLNPGLKSYVGEILMQRMMLHSYQLFQDNFTGTLTSYVKEVMSNIPDTIRLLADGFLLHIIALPLSIFVISQVHPILGCMLTAWLIVFILLSIILSRGVRPYSIQSSKTKNKVVGAITDILGNIISVRLFAAADLESKNFKQYLNAYYNADQKRDWYLLKMFAVLGTSFIVFETVACFWLINAFKKGLVTVGDFALVFSLSITLIDRLWDLSKHIGQLSDLIGSLQQSLELILSPIQIQDAENSKTLQVTKGIITFDHVQFSYNGNEPLFENKTITINAFEKVGLVGYSGGGKTTFVNLILRLYDLNAGKILIDDQDIKTVTQDSLRKSIALIPQDPTLFHRSLIDNIRYGKPEASDAEVIEAAKKAYAHEFIISLPNGYESLVGERGVKLSGGQRQRIAIARAFLKNSPILILDEATSQLDSITENVIQNSLKELMINKTTIVIAHRLSTLLQMDRILVFDKGKIVQDGTHEELLATAGGLYKHLWDAQVGGFLPA
jgi:ATP-binding cassette subfamily B protein